MVRQAESFEMSSDASIPRIDGNGMVGSITNFIISFPEFVPIAFTPKIPAVLPTEVTSDPESALKGWIPAMIYLHVIGAFTLVLLSHMCVDNVGLVRAATNAIFAAGWAFLWAFLPAWMNWFTAIKVHCSDRRCPCCLGRICYLIAAILHFLYFVTGTWRNIVALVSSIGGCFTATLAWCIVLVIWPGVPTFLICLANLFIYQLHGGEQVLHADRVAQAQARVVSTA
eukprot:TRINITY_DN54934_c0_g1_i1.p1 TRINITY_DN54934_c0_g1~~TRINITY_DN54934_c0_g1_i1.p1  ORF type:complete len:227 (+),score=19.07 TRINITY_DN54934_c0_g1_i1:101-781(+)